MSAPYYPEDAKLEKWIAYYYDDVNGLTIYDSTSSVWENLPSEGVQAVVKFYRMPDQSIQTYTNQGDDIYYISWNHISKILQKINYLKVGTMLDDTVFHPLWDDQIKPHIAAEKVKL